MPNPAHDMAQRGGGESRLLGLYTEITRLYCEQQQQLQDFMRQRPLYIMFEPGLGCDPRTDHLFPKDVSPLFAPKINALETSFRAGVYDVLVQGLGQQDEAQAGEDDLSQEKFKSQVLSIKLSVLMNEYQRLQRDFQQHLRITSQVIQQNKQVIRTQQGQMRAHNTSALYEADCSYTFKNLQMMLDDVEEQLMGTHHGGRYEDKQLSLIQLDQTTQTPIASSGDAASQTDWDFESDLRTLQDENDQLNTLMCSVKQEYDAKIALQAEGLQHQLEEKTQLIEYLNQKVDQLSADMFQDGKQKEVLVLGSVFNAPKKSAKAVMYDIGVQVEEHADAGDAQKVTNARISDIMQQSRARNNAAYLRATGHTTDQNAQDDGRNFGYNSNNEPIVQQDDEQGDELPEGQHPLGPQVGNDVECEQPSHINGVEVTQDDSKRQDDLPPVGHDAPQRALQSKRQQTKSNRIIKSKNKLGQQLPQILSPTDSPAMRKADDPSKSLRYSPFQTQQRQTHLRQKGGDAHDSTPATHGILEQRGQDGACGTRGYDGYDSGVQQLQHVASGLEQGHDASKKRSCADPCTHGQHNGNFAQERGDQREHTHQQGQSSHEGRNGRCDNHEQQEHDTTHQQEGEFGAVEEQYSVSQTSNDYDDSDVTEGGHDVIKSIVLECNGLEIDEGQLNVQNNMLSRRRESRQGVQYMVGNGGVNIVLANAANIIYDEQSNKYYEIGATGQRTELTDDELARLVQEQRENQRLIDKIEQFLQLRDAGAVISQQNSSACDKSTQTNITHVGRREYTIQPANTRFVKYSRVVGTERRRPKRETHNSRVTAEREVAPVAQNNVGIHYHSSIRPNNSMSTSRTRGFYLEKKSQLQKSAKVTADSKIYVVDMSNMMGKLRLD